MNRKLGLLVFLGIVTQGVLAQNYSLEQAIEYALKNNKNVKNADLGIESANEKVKETRAIGLPQVNAEGSFQNFLDIPTTVAPAIAFNPNARSGELVELQFGTEYNTNGTLSASQLIFSGSYLVGLKSSQAFRKVSEFQKIKTLIDVKENVIKAYYGVLVAKKSVTSLEKIATTSKAIYEQTKAVFDQGLIEEDNVTQLSLNVLVAQNSLSAAKRQLQNSIDMLKYQMGMKLEENLELTSNFDNTVSSLDSTASNIESKVSENIDFKLLNQQFVLNELNLKYEQSQYLPTLSAFFSHQQTAMRNDFDIFSNKPWYPTTIWGLNLSVPIFSSGSRNAKVSQAKITLLQSQNDLALLKDGLDVQTRIAKTDFDNAFENYETSKKAVDISAKIYKNYQIKFKEGLITSLDLSQIQTQYLSAESQYINSMYQLVNAKINLDKITNKL